MAPPGRLSRRYRLLGEREPRRRRGRVYRLSLGEGGITEDDGIVGVAWSDPDVVGRAQRHEEDDSSIVDRPWPLRTGKRPGASPPEQQPSSRLTGIIHDIFPHNQVRYAA